MTGRALAVATCLLSCVQSASANPLAPTYDEAALVRVQSRYPDGILGNFREVILPRLDPSDAAALADVAFEFPLQVDQAEPMAFYAQDGTIVMSAASLLFLDDLTTASAWLNENGYALNSLTDYVSMLKYGRFGETPPTPLEALCVPADALDDPGVSKVANIAFDTTVVFVMLHELAHVLYGHPGYHGVELSVARANEAQADRFALAGLDRLTASPLALIYFFAVQAHMAVNAGDFETQEQFEAHLAARTHPVDSGRISALVGSLANDPATVGLEGAVMEQVVGTLEEPDLQRIMAAIGRTATEANLAPRRPGELLGTPCGYVASGQDFDGPLDGTVTLEGTEWPVSLILARNGSSVVGSYSFGIATYAIEGETDGAQLEYRWYLDDTEGRGALRLGPDGVITGTWGNGASVDGGGVLRLMPRAWP